MPFDLRDYHPLWLDFPVHSAKAKVCNSPFRPHPEPAESCNTDDTTRKGLHIISLDYSPFARHYLGNLD